MYLRSLKRTVQLDIINMKMIRNVAELLNYLTEGEDIQQEEQNGS